MQMFCSLTSQLALSKCYSSAQTIVLDTFSHIY